jgi:NAD-dependent deacetylase
MSEGSPEIPQGLIATMGEARSVAVLTGSGISAESGVPTFREAQTGLWARYDPQQLATPEAFARDPGLVWQWYEWRRGLVAAAEPNAGHGALAELERRVPEFTLVTQNVDGLHARAGNREVVELHGNITRSKCSKEGVIVREYADDEKPPPCPRCGAPLRPDVVWFGEMLPAGALEAASEAARGCDLFLSIGTSSLVYPAAALPYEALEHGATVVEVNPDETPLTGHADYALRGRAGEVLPELVRRALSGGAGRR